MTEIDRVTSLIAVLVEEWGAENVRIEVPSHWEQFRQALGMNPLLCTTASTIEVSVKFEGLERLRYKIQYRSLYDAV